MPVRLSRDQSRRIDRLAIEEYFLPGIVLMENAAIAAAHVASQMLRNESSADVLVICGGGNNGGDGLAIARHLHNRGHRIRIALTIDPAKYQGDALINYRVAMAMHLRTESADPATIASVRPHLILDAIFGTGLSTAPRPPFAELVNAIANTASPVLAIDIPSGLDSDTGQPLGAAIIANQTITFVAEKTGFAAPQSKRYLGQVTVGDIGCPKELVARVATQR